MDIATLDLCIASLMKYLRGVGRLRRRHGDKLTWWRTHPDRVKEPRIEHGYRRNRDDTMSLDIIRVPSVFHPWQRTLSTVASRCTLWRFMAILIMVTAYCNQRSRPTAGEFLSTSILRKNVRFTTTCSRTQLSTNGAQRCLCMIIRAHRERESESSFVKSNRPG